MSLKDTYSCAWEALPVTMSNGTSVTSTINLGGLRLFSIILPPLWTNACLSFQTSADGGATWANMIDQNGDEITATVVASGCSVLDPRQFASLSYLRIRSGLSSAPVSQDADRTLHLILRSV